MKIPYVSPSRLKKAKECLFQYFLSYVWGWADELFTYTFCSEFGTSVHNTLEEYAESQGKADYEKIYAKQVAELKPFVDDMNKAPRRARESFFIDKHCGDCPAYNAKAATCGIMMKRVDDKDVAQRIADFEGCPKKLYDEGLGMVELAIKR